MVKVMKRKTIKIYVITDIKSRKGAHLLSVISHFNTSKNKV